MKSMAQIQRYSNSEQDRIRNNAELHGKSNLIPHATKKPDYWLCAYLMDPNSSC